jgi:uroporphyrin-III C-methyltransferase
MQPDTALGRVRLVGAGPGPADLLTVRAQRAIENADALLYDALVDDEVLALAPRACVRIQTGKRAGRASSMAQGTINRLILRLAQRGMAVVRLKGGDPSIFGRVGEEIEFLEAHGVPTEVIPGVTAACAAAAQFRFPLTHRGVARQVVFATARTQDGAVHLEGQAAADRETTLALYMARDSIAPLFDRLIAEGRPARTPATAIENAGSTNARLVSGDLRTLPAALSDAAFVGPVLVVVGEVAARARQGIGRSERGISEPQATSVSIRRGRQ